MHEPLTLPEFAKQLKRFAKEKGIKLKELFAATETPVAYCSKWAKGDPQGRPPYYYEVATWARMLDVPIDVMTYGE